MLPPKTVRPLRNVEPTPAIVVRDRVVMPSLQRLSEFNVVALTRRLQCKVDPAPVNSVAYGILSSFYFGRQSTIVRL